jgi:hypothetical protein
MTASLLTVAQMRTHLETGLTDEALQRLLDAEESEIVARYGAHTSATETLPGNGEWLILGRTPSSITSVTETETDNATATVLAANDYRLWAGGQLERLSTGTNGRYYWAPLVQVVYVPQDANDQRRAALVKLVTLSAAYTGTKAESIGSGDYSVTAADYTAERERILRSLAARKLWVV